MQSIVRDQPPPLSDKLPPALRNLVEKALEKDPAERYQTMHDMVVDLKRLTRLSGEATAVQVPVPVRKAKRSSASWLVAAALLVVGAVVWWTTRVPTVSGAIKSIAVLPLQNLSGDPSQEYFSDGTTEALISNLAQVQSLKVISRTSVMRYKGSTKLLRDIGRVRSGCHCRGMVQRIGGRVGVTAQLIEVASDSHIWAKDYEGEVADTLRLEEEASRSIAQEIRAQLTSDESKRFATAKRSGPVAQDEFLMGTAERWKSTPGGFL